MSKKNFKPGLEIKSSLGSVISGNSSLKPKVGRPKTQTKEITKSSQEGTKENEVRATFIVNEEILEKLKAIAYWERELIKEVVNRALEDYVKLKNPKPRPEEVRLKDQGANQRLIKLASNKARLPKY